MRALASECRSPFVPVCAPDEPIFEFMLPLTLCAEAADANPMARPAAKPVVKNFLIGFSRCGHQRATAAPRLSFRATGRRCNGTAATIGTGPRDAIQYDCRAAL